MSGLRYLTAGESHGPELVVIVDGVPAGLAVDGAAVDHDLTRRQGGYGRGTRSTRIERDHAYLLSGLADGRTTGAPIALRITNRDFANQPAAPPPLTTPRPGHADLAGGLKYGLTDFRQVRERASARETAARVAAGAIARQLLAAVGARIGSFVTSIGDVDADLGAPLGALDADRLVALAAAADANDVRTFDPAAASRMREAIDGAKAALDTVGGTFVVFAVGVPPGLGSYAQWDRRLDGRLAQAICSIHAVKGVEIGAAFAIAREPGTRAQDAIAWRDGSLARDSNHAGGLEGGITNGQPVVLRGAMKPLSSVQAPVRSVDLATGLAADAPYVRSDVCAVPAAAVVAEAMVAWVLAQALVERFGGDRLDLLVDSMSRAAAPGAASRPIPDEHT